MLLCPGAGGAAEITVFAAASLKNALDAIAADWETHSGDTVSISYGGSPALAKQILQGAPADIFVSASTGWMDTLADGNLIQPASRIDLLGNSLVLLSHARRDPVAITPNLDLAGLLAGGKLSMALADSVPAGQYGKQALQSLGLWASVEPFVVQTENVRAALGLVTSGEAALGIVYASDAVADDLAGDRATVIGTFPDDSHQPIVYPAALLTDATPRAAGFLSALTTPDATAIFKAQGFIVLTK